MVYAAGGAFTVNHSRINGLFHSRFTNHDSRPLFDVRWPMLILMCKWFSGFEPFERLLREADINAITAGIENGKL